MKKIFSCLLLFLFSCNCLAQTPTQNLRGRVLDKETQTKIEAVKDLILA